MPQLDRRRFLQLAGGATALSLLPTSIARAAALPANRQHGDLRDVEHIVVLMQENRSFDHYFGTMRGVRGFGDPHPVRLPNGKPVWNQDGVLPFHPDAPDLGLQFIEDLDHYWGDTHDTFNAGRYDQWVQQKSSTTMAHLTRQDIPFHYALADAFTVCDDYHCSLLGSTDPNRYYMWTGWVGNDGKGGGPVIANDEIGYSWTTYPERLEQAGVSWKIYQDVGEGLNATGGWGWTGDNPYVGNYGDNSLLYFNQYRDALPGSALYEKARTGTDNLTGQSFFDILAADVKHDRLPQISWVVAPEAFTEHPNWPANYGAWYVAKVIDALTSNPEVWSKTALLLTYDENDGFFDHVVPAYPNVGTLAGASTVPTTNEFFDGQINTPGGSSGEPGPYGLGVRVPMVVISPWSTGGWVCSQTFDHTSIIQLMERRFGVVEPNITPWRRAVAGDLTAAFDFGKERSARPKLPGVAAYKPKDDQRHDNYVPAPPAKGALPKQETGTRPARPLGYRFDLDAKVQDKKLNLRLKNPGRLGVALQVRSNQADTTIAPACYTLGAGSSLSAALPVTGAYDIDVHGPNGFYRHYADGTDHADLAVRSSTERDGTLKITLANTGSGPLHLRVTDVYTGNRQVRLRRGTSESIDIDTRHAGGWYDVAVAIEGSAAFVRHLAGRIETGKPGTSDPQFG